MAQSAHADHPLAALEEAFVDEYLRSRGYTRETLARLPRATARQVMAEAEAQASLLLALVESRSRYLSNIDEGATK